MWLSVWPQFPRNAGPYWVGWLLYGHLAVAVFIVVSGFSLALAPMRRGAALKGGTRHFLQRRAWRILPPYWAALVISTIISAYFMQPIPSTSALAKGFVVHGLLLQDVTGSLAPNGAFWSIAIEWQIYLVFPLILWFGRKTSIITSVTCTVALVLLTHAVAGLGSPFNKIDRLTVQFLALFAIGVLAVYAGRSDRATNFRRPLAVIGGVVLGVFVLLAVIEGSVWIVARYFWVDIVFGAGVACLMCAMYSGGLRRLRGLLASKVGLRLGLISYSIYLLHAPLVGVFEQHVFAPLHLGAVVTFSLLLAVGLPVILLLCYVFHFMFEAPFLHRRDRGALRAIPLFGGLFVRHRIGEPSLPAVAPEGVAARETP